MKLNNKGFTLMEVLAVVVILSILIVVVTPNVNYIINKNKDKNYNELQDGIINAAKVYLSDYRYNITLDYNEEEGLCNTNKEENISKIANITLIDSKLPIKVLIDSNILSTNSDGIIYNPKNDTQILDINSSYILIKYECDNKDYSYILEDNSLIWK